MIQYKYVRLLRNCIRKFSTKVKPQVKLDEEVSNNIDALVYKPRKHPGRIKPTTVIVPEAVVKAIQCVIEDHPMKTLVDEGEKFARFLAGRLPPIEQGEYKKIQRDLFEKVLEKESRKQKANQDEKQFKQSVKDIVQNKLKHKIYNWTAVNYDVYTSLLYLFARFAPDYAALVRIFAEINARDENFKPRTLFDFGSGVGTASWAANVFWKKHIFEYFNVDSSRDMNDLAQLLLLGGRGNSNKQLKGVFFRQFLPANRVAYDLVVCAFSLLELPSRQARLQTLVNLWNKTTQYLVIAEHGSIAGFKVISEARDFILSIEDESNRGFVYSPCPHDKVCPKFLTDTTCRFEILYHTLPFGVTSIRKERYSYVVLKKGERPADDSQWPRLLEAPMVRSKHTICRMCTASGALEEVIFTASKHGRSTYYCARSSEWGDRLPINLQTKESEES